MYQVEFYGFGAGWSSLVARRAHNPKVVSSNLAPATNYYNEFKVYQVEFYGFGAGWSSLVARRAHNPKVVSSNLAPATNYYNELKCVPVLSSTVSVRDGAAW